MPRKKKWPDETTKNFKLKLSKEKAARYQNILLQKNKTVQQDFEDRVEQVIN